MTLPFIGSNCKWLTVFPEKGVGAYGNILKIWECFSLCDVINLPKLPFHWDLCTLDSIIFNLTSPPSTMLANFSKSMIELGGFSEKVTVFESWSALVRLASYYFGMNNRNGGEIDA